MSSQTSVDSILAYIAGVQIATYLHVSSAALLLVDWIFMLDVEVSYAWNADAWHFGRILFFLTRYSVFVDTSLTLYHHVGYSISVPSCALIYTISGWILLFGIVLAELILTIRVWALWGRRRNIGIFLIVAGIVDCSAGSVAYALYGPSYSFTAMDSLSPSTPGCFLNSDGKTLQWSFVALIVHQTVIFALTVIKGFRHYRMGVYGASLLQTFYRDGATYYAVLIVLSVINIAVVASEFDIAYANLLTSIQRVFHSILSARMLLHLRQDADLRRIGNENSRSSTTFQIDGLVFEHSTGSSDILPTTQTASESHIRDDGWFGQDESASLRQRRTDPEAS